MGYLSIDNLYKNTDILLFKECYALEKIHGTSAHIAFKDKLITFFSGGEKHEKFIKLFDASKLLDIYNEKFIDEVTLYGEAYGGSQQGMSGTYGQELKFIVFDVKIGYSWLSVPDAEEVTKSFGLEFVSYEKINTYLTAIDFERNLPSEQAKRNGIKEPKIKEGIVLRPLIEVKKNNGERIICKHKNDEFRETKTPRIVSDKKLKILSDTQKIANEWVTLERLKHVLDKLPPETSIESTGLVIKSMIKDIYREAKGEIVESALLQKTIGRTTALLFKKYLNATITPDN